MADRAYIAARIYSLVQSDFAHWEQVASYDFDTAFKNYLRASLAAPTRRDFLDATRRLLAGLQNDHTHLTDLASLGKPSTTGFTARKLDGAWVVVTTSRADLRAGDVIARVDGKPVEQWAQPVYPLMDKTNQREKTLSLFGSPPADQILPYLFALTLKDGRQVTVDRTQLETSSPIEAKTEVFAAPGDVLRIRIPSFGSASFEEDALRAVRTHQNARAILFDLRGNNGGTTPSDLLAAIMTKPYPGMIAQTPVHVGLFDARAMLGDADEPLAGASLRLPASVVQPDHPIFAGRIVVLDDAYCVSACEDFVVAIHNARRGVIVGERTYGSTGQPALVTFETAAIAIAVGAQREFFPDGSPFEGVGVMPDVEAESTREGLVAGEDEPLAKALQIAR